MNLKGRYTIVGAVFTTFIIVFFVPFDGEVGGRCKTTCLDYSPLEKEINSLQAVPKDLIVMDSQDIGNKSFEELRLEKFKQIIRGQKKLQMTLLNKEVGKDLGNKDWILDCITWSPVKQKNTHKNSQNLNSSSNELPLSSQSKQETVYIPKTDKQGTSAGSSTSGREGLNTHSQRLMAILHVVITKLKQDLNKNTISVLDVYCGNLTWMTTFLKIRTDIHYTGIDNRKDVISNNKKLYKGVLPLAKFYFYDSLKSRIWEKFDLVLLFGVLEWLDSHRALKMLSHISLSDSTYLLVSMDKRSNNNNYHQNGENNSQFTHSSIRDKEQNNVQVKKHSPGYFLHDLEESPFLLDSPVCVNNDQYKNKQGSVILWSLPLKRKLT